MAIMNRICMLQNQSQRKPKFRLSKFKKKKKSTGIIKNANIVLRCYIKCTPLATPPPKTKRPFNFSNTSSSSKL